VKKCKWVTLLYLYTDVYLKPRYEKDMDMAKLYIHYKVADCSEEDIPKSKKEIEGDYEKVDKRYSNY
jgi:hypothetical protein